MGTGNSASFGFGRMPLVLEADFISKDESAMTELLTKFEMNDPNTTKTLLLWFKFNEGRKLVSSGKRIETLVSLELVFLPHGWKWQPGL